MRKVKQILTVLMCALLLISTMSVTAFAAGSCSITIQDPDDSEATVAGKTFKVYKVFDATTNGANTSYSWNGDDYQEFFSDKGMTTLQDAVEYIHEQNDAENMDDFAKEMKKYIDDKNIDPTVPAVTAPPEATSVVIPDLDYGYYLVYDATAFGADTSAVRSAVMLTTVNKNVTITLKANRPHIDKWVIGNDNVAAKGTSSSIGDVMTFKLVTKVPDHSLYDKYTYKIKDVLPTGMELVAGTLKVENTSGITTAYDVEYNKAIDPTEKALTQVPDDQNEWDFVIKLTNIKDLAEGTEITVTYDAKLTTDAARHNINTAMLVYSNDPSDTDNSIGASFSTASVYSYRMVLTKFASDTAGNFINKRLAGAEFQLFEDGSSDPIKFTTVSATEGHHTYTQYVVDPEGTVTTLSVHNEGEETPVIDHLNYGGHRGDITIFGLAEGTYKLVETKSPNGYVKPETPFYITIEDQIGQLGSVGVLSVTGNHTGSTGTIVNTNGMAEEILTVWAEITNQPGSALPETGGMGTVVFTIIGLVLMAGAASYVFLRKKA